MALKIMGRENQNALDFIQMMRLMDIIYNLFLYFSRMS